MANCVLFIDRVDDGQGFDAYVEIVAGGVVNLGADLEQRKVLADAGGLHDLTAVVGVHDLGPAAGVVKPVVDGDLIVSGVIVQQHGDDFQAFGLAGVAKVEPSGVPPSIEAVLFGRVVDALVVLGVVGGDDHCFIQAFGYAGYVEVGEFHCCGRVAGEGTAGESSEACIAAGHDVVDELVFPGQEASGAAAYLDALGKVAQLLQLGAVKVEYLGRVFSGRGDPVVRSHGEVESVVVDGESRACVKDILGWSTKAGHLVQVSGRGDGKAIDANACVVLDADDQQITLERGCKEWCIVGDGVEVGFEGCPCVVLAVDVAGCGDHVHSAAVGGDDVSVAGAVEVAAGGSVVGAAVDVAVVTDDPQGAVKVSDVLHRCAPQVVEGGNDLIGCVEGPGGVKVAGGKLPVGGLGAYEDKTVISLVVEHPADVDKVSVFDVVGPVRPALKAPAIEAGGQSVHVVKVTAEGVAVDGCGDPFVLNPFSYVYGHGCLRQRLGLRLRLRLRLR